MQTTVNLTLVYIFLYKSMYCCLLNDKNDVQKVWSKNLGYENTFQSSSRLPEQFNVMTKTIVTFLSTNYVKTKLTYTLFLFYSA